MKQLGILIWVLICLAACGGGGDGADSGDDSRTLTVGKAVTGSVESVGEVDWYTFEAIETNSILQITCGGKDMLPVVDYLVTVYEEGADGRLTRLWADHAPEDAAQPADLTINIAIDTPKTLRIAVRDLMDDESAPEDRYSLMLTYFNLGTDNVSFSQATDMGPVDAAEVCRTDSIEYKGDVDCFRFDASQDGVYSVRTQFVDTDRSTPVHLEMKLYDNLGNVIYPTSGIHPDTNHFLVYLDAGEHFAVVQDRGRDHLDPGHHYTMCVSPVSVQEALFNDSEETAQPMPADSGPVYTVNGTLAYQQDQDWYWLSVPPVPGSEVQTLVLTFTDQVPSGNFPFLILMQGPDGSGILAHEYPSGADGYTVQVRVAEGDNAIGILPRTGATVVAGLDYRLSAEIVTVDDDAESGDANDQMVTAQALALPAGGSVTASGKIAFRGDTDWYTLNVPNATVPQILGIAFSTGEPSDVEYCVEVKDSDGRTVSMLSDIIDPDTPARLETSFYVARGAESQYYIKVGDCQNDDGADIPYELTVSTADLPDSVAAPAGLDLGGRSIHYVSEADERGWSLGDFDDSTDAVTVTCIVHTQLQPTFSANKALLAVDSLDGANQHISDWIAGYVDYQGDQDWYMLDIAPMIPAGGSALPDQWYYDIAVRLYSPGGTSNAVEYTWKLYRDVAHDSTPPNKMVLERTPSITNTDYVEDTDGILAGWSSPLITAADPSPVIDKTVPDGGEDFWIGDQWQHDRYYLSISDFNYTRIAEDQRNPEPDDDWGYAAPYFFQVRLTFHPGQSAPE